MLHGYEKQKKIRSVFEVITVDGSHVEVFLAPTDLAEAGNHKLKL